MESSPKNGDSGRGGQRDSILRPRPLYKGIILGFIIGVFYCLSMQGIASRTGLWTNGPELAAGNLSKDRPVSFVTRRDEFCRFLGLAFKL